MPPPIDSDPAVFQYILAVSSFFDGTVSNDEINYYRMRSVVGIIITGVANVDSSRKGIEDESDIKRDRFILSLRKDHQQFNQIGQKPFYKYLVQDAYQPQPL